MQIHRYGALLRLALVALGVHGGCGADVGEAEQALRPNACTDEQCDDVNAGNTVAGDDSSVLVGLSYLKASNTGFGDLFGTSIALSGDGTTLAVGAPGEASGAAGIDLEPAGVHQGIQSRRGR